MKVGNTVQILRGENKEVCGKVVKIQGDDVHVEYDHRIYVAPIDEVEVVEHFINQGEEV